MIHTRHLFTIFRPWLVLRGLMPRRCHGFGLLLALSPVLAVGCIGPRNYENENDQLRAERMKQDRLIEKLQQTLERRTQELSALQQQVEGAQPMQGVPTPHLAGLTFGRYSAAVDTDDDGKDDAIRLYVEPVDQDGRLLPVAGRATLQAALVDPGAQPKIVAEQTYSPEQFDQAYRSTLLGRHYTLKLTLGKDVPKGKTDLTVKVKFTNAATGADHTQQMAVTVKR